MASGGGECGRLRMCVHLEGERGGGGCGQAFISLSGYERGKRGGGVRVREDGVVVSSSKLEGTGGCGETPTTFIHRPLKRRGEEGEGGWYWRTEDR